MPNNNPHGHNQYTKPELRSQRSKKPVVPAGDASHTDNPHTDDPHGTDGAHDHGANDSQGSSHRTPHDAQPMNVVHDLRPSDAPAVRPASGTSRRGFASMDAALQREIASKGGHSQGRENNPGNFANNRERAREAGRKGGEAHGHR